MESQCVSAVRMDTDVIQDLIRGSSIPWMPATVSSYLEVLLSQGSCDVDKKLCSPFLRKVCFGASASTTSNVNLQAACTAGRTRIFRLPAWREGWFHIVPGAEAFYQNAASLIKVSIFIKQERADLVFEVADRLLHPQGSGIFWDVGGCKLYIQISCFC